MSEYAMLIDGAAVTSSDSFDVINPATDEVFAQAPACSPAQLDAAMAAASGAFESWRMDDEARRAALRAAAEVLESKSDDLAPLLTTEQGKPLRDAFEEIEHCCLWLRYYAELEIPRQVSQDQPKRYAEVVRRPMGVVAAITPWNFPLTLAMWKIAPALRAGNTLVVKPSPYTPLATLMLGAVLQGAFPPGVINVISGRDPLGAAMTSHPTPRKINFTGSTSTGKHVAATAASDLKRVTLELGGNDPAIVLEDVDVDSIAKKLYWGAFRNSGQVCLAVKRVYVHERVHDKLVDAMASLVQKTVVGDGTAPEVDLGPLNNRAQYDWVNDLVADARHRGARAISGGSPVGGNGYFVPPTVLKNVSDGVRVVDEEQFGPAIPIVSFRDIDDAIRRSNKSPYGLTASVWSADVEHAYQVAGGLDCGQVSINVHGGAVRPDLPFGGHKMSGIGVENGTWGLESFTEMQTVAGPGRAPMQQPRS